jgi:hypothetical protein
VRGLLSIVLGGMHAGAKKSDKFWAETDRVDHD